MLHTSDLEPDDFGILAGKVVSRTGLSGPFQLTEGTIDAYTNQTGKPELVWAGGTEELPACCWIVFPGMVGEKVKIKVANPEGPGWCDEVVACVVSDLERGGGVQEKYALTFYVGPPWQIVTVTYGENDTVVDFSADTGVDRITLMGALNASDNLPDNWYWSVVAGEMVLSVPYGTNVTRVVMPGGLEMQFSEPSVAGVAPSTLAAPMAESLAGPMDTVIAQYEQLLDSYEGQLANTFGVGTATTEAAIQTEFAANSKIEVRWTDADGDPRVSYKDPINGWYHPVEKAIDAIAAYLYQPLTNQTVSMLIVNQNVNLTAYGVPANARYANIKLTVKMQYAATGTGQVQVFEGGIEGLKTGYVHEFYMFHTSAELAASPIGRVLCENMQVRVKAGGQLRVTFTADKPANLFLSVKIEVVGWSR
jgi:hypothetical protein